MTPQVSGYILAGGQSSRMGTDKAMLRLNGATLLEMALAKVQAVCGNAAILCGPAERAEQLAKYGRCVPDSIEGCGPLGGLDAALHDAEHEWLLIVPVDLPLLPEVALRDLLDLPVYFEQPTVLHYEAEGRPQTLPLVIHRSAAEEVTEALQRGERKLMPILQRFAEASGGPYRLLLSRLRENDWFANVNTPEEFARVVDESAYVADAGSPPKNEIR